MGDPKKLEELVHKAARDALNDVMRDMYLHGRGVAAVKADGTPRHVGLTEFLRPDRDDAVVNPPTEWKWTTCGVRQDSDGVMRWFQDTVDKPAENT